MSGSDCSDSAGEFLWHDYLVFGSMLILSAGIGIFFGIKDRKKQDTTKLVIKGKSIGAFPITMSLIASFMSAITLLGKPTEFGKYGMLYWLTGFFFFMVMPAAAYLYLPGFVHLQVTRAYKWLEIRFHRYIGLLGSVLFELQMALCIGILDILAILVILAFLLFQKVQVVLSIFGKIGGHLLGLVSLGMFSIWANYKSQKFHPRKFGIRYCGSMYRIRAFLSLLLVTLVIGGVQSQEISEDCSVKVSMKLYTTHKQSWIAFLNNDTYLNILVAYEEINELSDSDGIYINVNRINKEKSRNRVVTGEELSLNKSLPLGWSNFSTEVENDTMKITINSFNFEIKLDYPVHFISVASDHMASCKKGKPTWEVTRGKRSTIPAEGQDNLQFSIHSNKSFSPVLHMNEASIIMQYNSGVEISQYDKKLALPSNSYEFILKNDGTRLILQSKQVDGELEELLDVKMTETFMDIGVSSLDEDFRIEISPLNLMYEKGLEPTRMPNNGVTRKIEDEGQTLSNLSIPTLLSGIAIGILLCGLIVMMLIFILRKQSYRSKIESKVWISTVLGV